MPNKSSLVLQIALLMGTVLNPCAAFAHAGVEETFLYEKGHGHVRLDHNAHSVFPHLHAIEPEDKAAVVVKLNPPSKIREIGSVFKAEKHSSDPLISFEYTSGKDAKLRYSTIKVHKFDIDVAKIIGTDAIVHRFAIIAVPDESEGTGADFALDRLEVDRRLVGVRLNEKLSDGDPLVQHE